MAIITQLSRLLARVGSDCPACGGLSCGGLLCRPCTERARATLRDDAAYPPVMERTVSAFAYAPPFDVLIARYKGMRRYTLAGALAGLLHDAWPPGLRLDVLVPVPASRASLRARGFNPAAELAAALGPRVGAPVRRRALRRTREDGMRQAQRSRHARLIAAQGLFVCRENLYGLRVGLVDDVMTTGSTAHAAAQALRAAGAAEVVVLVAARTPLPAAKMPPRCAAAPLAAPQRGRFYLGSGPAVKNAPTLPAVAALQEGNASQIRLG